MQDDSGLNPWLNRRILCIGAKVGAGGNNRSVLIVSGDNSDFVMTVDAEEQLISGALDFVVFSTNLSREEKTRLRIKLPFGTAILNLETLIMPFDCWICWKSAPSQLAP